MVQDDFWSKLKKRVRDVSVMAADFTEEQALIGKLKFDILTLKRKVDRTQRDIGARVCELAAEKSDGDTLSDKLIKTLIKDIEVLNKQIEIKKDEISKVADQVRSSRSRTDRKTSAATPKEPKKTASKPRKKAATKAKKPTAKKESTTTGKTKG